MRVSALMLVTAAALALTGCTTEIYKGFLGEPPSASAAPRVPAYYSPTDGRVIGADPARVTYDPVLTQ
jgi:hypothetical protein